MKDGDFIFHCDNLLHCKFHKNLNLGGSYIDSLVWITTKKTTINPINGNKK